MSPHTSAAERKAYLRRYFLSHKAEIYARRYTTGSARYSEYKRRRRARAFIRKAKDVPCADCGIRYDHWIMEFDHTEDKAFTVSHIQHAHLRLDLLAAEIAKCDVVCANCHRERTWRRRCEAESK